MVYIETEPLWGDGALRRRGGLVGQRSSTSEAQQGHSLLACFCSFEVWVADIPFKVAVGWLEICGIVIFGVMWVLPELTKDVQLVAMEICERLGKRVESCSIMFVLVPFTQAGDKRDENQISCLALQDLFVAGDALIQLYHNFITDFETKINLLKLAHFAVIVSRQYTEKEAAVRYLEGVIEKLRGTRELRIEEPILYIKMQIAVFNLEKGDQKECKKLLEDGKSTLDSMTDIDPSVYASYYWVSSQYYKSRQEFAEFYKSALLYLAYTSVESLSETFKLAASMETEKEKTGWDLAFDLSLSALLGDNIYNFGELLAHPIVRILYQKFLISCLFFHLYLN
ncbi:26S proteasome non-ATPase regulatory subunit 13-like A [Vitis vinifera]|uniref:26S proteasome non-ATPase regulatory subunit 13-like A n=1 Tax=Vitis vinifera TaxID=29760 RepID=A0A438H0M9_VITVI|nr:26S proteasome non-ATPase regulatory subunit 13-like A [Vitis vinifera]